MTDACRRVKALSRIRKDWCGGGAFRGRRTSSEGMASPTGVPSRPVVSDGDADKVFLWRLEQFCQLGLNVVEATELAASDADLGQARYVLGSGCAPELALDILR